MAEVTICFNEMLKRKLVRLSPSDLGQSQQGIRQDSWRLVEAAAKEEEYEETGEFVCETGFCSPGFSSWVPGVLLGVHGGRVGTYRTYPPAAARPPPRRQRSKKLRVELCWQIGRIRCCCAPRRYSCSSLAAGRRLLGQREATSSHGR